MLAYPNLLNGFRNFNPNWAAGFGLEKRGFPVDLQEPCFDYNNWFVPMRCSVVVVTALGLAVCTSPASAQIYTSIADLAFDADLVAVATIDRVMETPSPTARDRTLTVELRLGQILRGQPSSTTVLATLAETCIAGGSGPGHICVSTVGMEGLSGLWLLKAEESGYRILPIQRVTRSAMGLFLPLPVPSSNAPQPAEVDSLLFAYQVRWIQSLEGPLNLQDEDRLYAAFSVSWKARPNQDHVLAAIAPLLASPLPRQHAMGLVIALQAESVDALTQVVDEIATLRSNPRFSEIVFTIGASPPNGVPGSKSPRWMAPIRRLLALHLDIPGLDASAAAVLYRIGTPETWPLIVSLLDSKDPNAQMIAVRTIAIRLPAAMATDETHRYTPGTVGPPITTGQYAQFWKTWWTQNRASLGFASQNQ